MTGASAALPATTCKCCGGHAKHFGAVDFHKNCEIAKGRNVLTPSGVPVPYHRCEECGFLFTIVFDSFTQEDFAELVYNDDYALVDPDFADLRPRANAAFIAELFAAHRSTRILDYGGGNGLTAELLRGAGFTNVTTYDPFVPAHSARPTGRFELILCFEVVEHSPDPHGTFEDIDSLVATDGIVLFSTLVQPAEITSFGLDWWYAAPRNGHVSLHSRESIAAITAGLGYNFGSFNDNLHVLFRTVPAFAQHLLRPAA
jgi:SAM-dependent methyltransferase